MAKSILLITALLFRALQAESPESLFKRGSALQARGDLEGAIRYYSQAIELNSGYAIAYVNRGRSSQLRGDLDAALIDYSRALEIDPRLADAYLNRGNVRQIRGNLVEAVADYDRALAVNPRFPVVMSMLFGTSGIGQQFTFSVVPGGQCPEVTLYLYLSRVL